MSWPQAQAGPSSPAAHGSGAAGGATAAEWQWALSVVHSRTFANAAPGGGVGVRMLVPLADFLNHAGDELQLGPSGQPMGVKVTDNVRCVATPLRIWITAAAVATATLALAGLQSAHCPRPDCAGGM